MRHLPPIDMHAHIEPDIAATDLLELGALVFAASRTLEEAARALERSDPWTLWGVGCHPGLVGAHKAFDPDRFTELIARTPYVSEIGLDGKSRVPAHTQQATFHVVLTTLQAAPRIASIHSYAAAGPVLDHLTAHPITGAVLHWWLGDADQTRRAVELGCYFSVNASMARRPELLSLLPPERILTETDHPFADRSTDRGRRPGNVSDVEAALGRLHTMDLQAVRELMWHNLAELVRSTKCGTLLPRPVRVTLAAVA
jgi:TatD DNase family protein